MPRLPEPEPPTLPIVKAEELMCLSPEAYRKLVERDHLRRDYAEELRAILRAANQGKP